jgi:DNA processing protein
MDVNAKQNSLIDHNDLRSWICLHRISGIGPVLYHKLLNQFGTPDKVLQASAAQLSGLGLKPEIVETILSPDWDQVGPDLEWLQQQNCHILTIAHPLYPALLKEISAPPPLLYVHGDPELLSSLQLAIVGSRNPSTAGASNAYEFAHHLGAAGLTITSGLALGVDAASHRGALDAGAGTIAITGTGLDRVYPAKNKDLAHAIVANGGALVSEFPIGEAPQAGNFPRRNRIISGLSLGTLVVEAALRSGSLITAKYAMDQAREVFAIPGSIHNPLAKGCHALIQQGAKLVETAQDIISELAPLANVILQNEANTTENDNDQADLDHDYQKLLDVMGYDPCPVDELIERSGLTAEEVSSMLLILELQNYVQLEPGGQYTRSPK